MRIGICTEITNIQIAEKVGYDYIEPNAGNLFNLTEEEIQQLEAEVAAANIKPEVFNCLVRGEFAIFADNSDWEQLKHYLVTVLSRAKRLGADLVIMGSGTARSIPEHLTGSAMWERVADYFNMLDDICESVKINVAIEPLRKQETNLFNYVHECVKACYTLKLKRIKVLADMYHMICGEESYASLSLANEQLAHVHISHTHSDQTREYINPACKEQLSEFWQALKIMNYSNRISVEARCPDVATVGKIGHDVIREVIF